MPKNTTFFHKKLITWYLENKRALPWRQTKDPYRIWLSEIILQQTRVAQGLPYYERFVSAYPTVFDLANAEEEQVLKLWQGLGYYSRARNLHTTAKHVASELKGVFPEDHKRLLQLKGVGDYTASAIASICYGVPTAVVDGNVYRVLARVFGIETPINSSQGAKEFKILAQEVMDTSQPGTYNQAIMEFGARYCIPRNPDCQSCIFNNKCVAFKEDKVSQLPVKLKKLKVKKRFFNYLVLISENNRTVLNKRKGKGIWQNLYEFPLIESKKEISEEALKANQVFLEISGKYEVLSVSKYNDSPIVHKLSHQHLHTTFWVVEVSALEKNNIPLSDVEKYPVPILVANFISGFGKFQH